MSRVAMCLALMGSIAMSGWAVAASVGPSPAKGQGPQDIKLWVMDLGSAEFSRREAAQKQLEGLPISALEDVKKAQAEAGDAEIKARLAQVIERLEERLALNPPPMAFHVKDATINDIVYEIQRIGHQRPVDFNVMPQNKYTLDV